ncbi:MAG: hypothetical protein N3A38_17075, partial [Planctomycetota bacterium]|nr:hypothetical protein [Planctomycetota bacterium]
MAELREVWNRRDAETVAEAARRMAARTMDADAQAALNLEASRARLLARLHRRVVDGINMSEGTIRDAIFLDKPI